MVYNNNNLLKKYHFSNKVDSNNFSLEGIHFNSSKTWDLVSLMEDLLDNNKVVRKDNKVSREE